MDKDTSTILITIAVTDASLKAAYELALAMGEDEGENSILQTAPASEDTLIVFTTRLLEIVRELGLFEESACRDTRLIVGTVYRKGTSRKE